ncbi:cytochrome-c peroxidase [Tenacibaculum caenipelagi]|uniref:Cytochrome c peroxidase n=1 Tax=Tenacibaculum caenipelagi TaxID=1325435 RepID=A0A4R6TEW2_9FLAO|nr:cytochrome c peroxidase [Tenacibaculum caenipelagi]TDQ25666.1 cytochrome c peroxidase [Tenacibaculum caenipelagi]
MKSSAFLCLFLITCFFSCSKEEAEYTPVGQSSVLNLPKVPFNYSNPNFPNSFNSFVMDVLDNTPTNNPTTDAGATLGRVLFYDKNMSANNTVSCASCHIQNKGFSDDRKLSVGFDGGLTGRNSMGLANARFGENGKFFWDHRAATLEEQVLMPIQDEIEMGMNLDDLIVKLSALEYYPALFTEAFGSSEITSDKISKALAQFVRSMVSYQTKYDEGLAQTGNLFDNFPNFTAQENLGKSIFNGSFRAEPGGNCAICHMNNGAIPVNPTSNLQNLAIFTMVASPRNNGIDPDGNVADTGIGGATGAINATGAFKAPSLRNIELTAPYMHDGRLATLEDVVEHYSTGVLGHPQLSAPALVDANGNPIHLNLSQIEKDALVAFLKTLTDYEFITDEKYANPFND